MHTKEITLMLLMAVSWAACNGPGKKENGVMPKGVQTASKHTDVFNQSFAKLLVSYYSLKDALVEDDTVKANAASRQLAADADGLQIKEIKNDSTQVIKETAKNYTGAISGSASEFIRETDLPKKKKEFQMISDVMYDLIRAVRYDRQTVYHQHCPMAFNNNEEAYWLSNSSNIVNPYLGKNHPKYRAAMLECGEVTDSLDFSGK